MPPPWAVVGIRATLTPVATTEIVACRPMRPCGSARSARIGAGKVAGVAERYDAVVVGGGHNGLTCAAYLARAGWSVLVLERRHVLGGATVTEEVFPGFK